MAERQIKTFFMDSIGRLDVLCWCLVIVFFSGCAFLFEGNFLASLAAALGVVFVMLLIGLSIEIIIEALKGVKGLGTITGFITNGPELICLIAGLVAGDILFASSTSLGSNFMNPLLLTSAALVTGSFWATFRTNWRYTALCLLLTSGFAVVFYVLPQRFFGLWAIIGVIAMLVLFLKRPEELELESGEELGQGEKESMKIPGWAIFPASILLIAAGYFLDPVVSYASLQSHAPKGVIGFFVLATLSSWPEFKCCLGLLRRRRYLSAILNITVSNITNIWLAIAGVVTWLFVS